MQRKVIWLPQPLSIYRCFGRNGQQWPTQCEEMGFSIQLRSKALGTNAYAGTAAGAKCQYYSGEVHHEAKVVALNTLLAEKLSSLTLLRGPIWSSIGAW